jgi:hypothetical protein
VLLAAVELFLDTVAGDSQDGLEQLSALGMHYLCSRCRAAESAGRDSIGEVADAVEVAVVDRGRWRRTPERWRSSSGLARFVCEAARHTAGE